jgi:polyisoprenoid-binding protein YceI
MFLRLLATALLTAGFALSGAHHGSAADYAIDSEGAHASINFRVKHLGFSWLTGRFDKFNGTFSYDKASPEASKVKVEIDPASINSNHGKRDKHLRGSDFLDVDVFPEASFISTSIKPAENGKFDIVGDLTLKGVTKEIVIKAESIGGGKDPWGGFRQGFTGTTSFALADFDINYNLGPASKDVFLTLEVEGIRQ